MNDWVIGIDLGRTKIALGLVNEHNQIVAQHRIATQAEQGPAVLVGRIAQAVAQLVDSYQPGLLISALGICAPGPVDFTSGMIGEPSDLNAIHHMPLRQLLSERLALPVSLDHDAKSAALGECYYGAGRGAHAMAYIVVGTGVGAAMVIDGTVIRGLTNQAGEIGHTTINRHGELCSCGSRGCIETYLSGPWLERRYHHRRARFGQPGPAVTGTQITALAQQGDPLARHILAEAGEALGIAIASLAMTLDIDLFIIGGGVVQAGDLLLEPARRIVPEYSFRSLSKRVQIVGSSLGEEAAILGCAWQARERRDAVRP